MYEFRVIVTEEDFMYKIGNWQDLGVDPQQSNRDIHCFFKEMEKKEKKVPDICILKYCFFVL
jgi:hypothetical protein